MSGDQRELPDFTDEELIAFMYGDQRITTEHASPRRPWGSYAERGPMANVLMSLRLKEEVSSLREAIEAANIKTERLNTTMVNLTWGLVGLTVFLAGVAIIQIWAAFIAN